MKRNCQILSVNELAREAADCIQRLEGAKIKYKVDSCTLSDNGDLSISVWNEQTNRFDIMRRFTGNELAYIVNMPLWEVVMIDRGGFDERAILFYEL